MVSDDTRWLIIDAAVVSGLLLVGLVGVVVLADTPGVERSHDERPTYLAAPADSIQHPWGDSSGWDILVLCPDSGLGTGTAVDGAPNRSAAVDRMADLPPPVRYCLPFTE